MRADAQIYNLLNSDQELLFASLVLQDLGNTFVPDTWVKPRRIQVLVVWSFDNFLTALSLYMRANKQVSLDFCHRERLELFLQIAESESTYVIPLMTAGERPLRGDKYAQ